MLAIFGRFYGAVVPENEEEIYGKDILSNSNFPHHFGVLNLEKSIL